MRGTPVGTLFLTATSGHLTHIGWEATASDADSSRDCVVDRDLLDRAVSQLREYFVGERSSFDLPLAARGSVFSQRVWHELRHIEPGQPVSYSSLARRLHLAHGARAIARACATNPLPIVVPCHRVVGSDGSLRGFLGGLDAKRWLLEHERPTIAG